MVGLLASNPISGCSQAQQMRNRPLDHRSGFRRSDQWHESEREAKAGAKGHHTRRAKGAKPTNECSVFSRRVVFFLRYLFPNRSSSSPSKLFLVSRRPPASSCSLLHPPRTPQSSLSHLDHRLGDQAVERRVSAVGKRPQRVLEHPLARDELAHGVEERAVAPVVDPGPVLVAVGRGCRDAVVGADGTDDVGRDGCDRMSASKGQVSGRGRRGGGHCRLLRGFLHRRHRRGGSAAGARRLRCGAGALGSRGARGREGRLRAPSADTTRRCLAAAALGGRRGRARPAGPARGSGRTSRRERESRGLWVVLSERRGRRGKEGGTREEAAGFVGGKRRSKVKSGADDRRAPEKSLFAPLSSTKRCWGHEPRRRVSPSSPPPSSSNGEEKEEEGTPQRASE